MALTPILIPSPEQERWLDKHVPYRIQILRGLEIYNANSGPDGLMRPVFPCIYDASLIACRWAASFLGLCYETKSRTLAQVRQRRDDDVYVIDLGGTLVDPDKLPQKERELLGAVLVGANRASAHPVREGKHWMVVEQVDRAAPLLIAKIKSQLYDILGWPFTEWTG